MKHLTTKELNIIKDNPIVFMWTGIAIIVTFILLITVSIIL